MQISVIQSAQAMSNNQRYRPRSPDLPGVVESQKQPPLRLNRLPSYQIEEPTLPKGYSFSPRGSYDASPFFSQNVPTASNVAHIQQPDNVYPDQVSGPFHPVTVANQPPVFSPINRAESPQRYQQGLGTFQPYHYQNPYPHQQPSHVFQPVSDDMARLRARKPVDYNEDHNGGHYTEPYTDYQEPMSMHHMPHQPQRLTQSPLTHQFIQQPSPHGLPPQMHPQQQQQPPPPPPPQFARHSMPQIDVKTKFPVARIKRIMQADEDVGKVAQATPTAVSKALELFMIALVTKGAAEAKDNNSKRVTATHLKHALISDPQFDFLNEICEAVPDEGAKSSKGRAKSEAKSEDSSEDMGGVSKRKNKGNRRKKSGDDEGSD